MIWYLDTGLLVKLYVPEPESAQVADLVNAAPAVAISPLHRLEMTLALNAKQARGELTPAQTARALAHIAEDIAARRFRTRSCDWSAVLDLARALGEKHGVNTPARSLDVLHIAAARHLRAASFVTSDKLATRLRRGSRVAMPAPLRTLRPPPPPPEKQKLTHSKMETHPGGELNTP